MTNFEALKNRCKTVVCKKINTGCLCLTSTKRRLSIDEIEVGERLADAELFASWTPLFEPPAVVVKRPKLDVAVLAAAG